MHACYAYVIYGPFVCRLWSKNHGCSAEVSIYTAGILLVSLVVPSIIHSFRTDENYVMGRDSVVSCMLVMYIDNFCTFVIHNQPRRNCGLEFTFLLYGARFLLAGENVNKCRDRSQEARGSNHSMHPSSPLRTVPALHNKLSPVRHGFNWAIPALIERFPRTSRRCPVSVPRRWPVVSLKFS